LTRISESGGTVELLKMFHYYIKIKKVATWRFLDVWVKPAKNSLCPKDVKAVGSDRNKLLINQI